MSPFMDKILEFWDGQALTVQEESRTNGDMLDNETGGATDAQLGFNYINLVVSTGAGGMASGGYFQLVISDSETFASGVEVLGGWGSAEDPLSAADLAANARFSMQAPLRPMKKYTEMEWVPVNEAATDMVVDCWTGMEAVCPLNIQKEPT